MDQIKNFFQNILSSLRVRAVAGGLEISDQVLRLVYFSGKEWQMTAVRLVPGIMEKGKIKDAAALTAALTELKMKAPFGGKSKKKKMNVIVALSSVKMYSQVFALPSIGDQGLSEAVDLNLRMLSPFDAAQAYSGWEVIGKDEANGRTEVAAAFVDKALVQEMTQVLYAAGFVTVGVESRALALTRIFRDKGAGADTGKSYLLLDIDNSGIDFLVIRNGQLYFEYPNDWADLGDDKGQISMTRLQDTLSGSLRQVMNFYGQHWPEPLAAVILSAIVFQNEAEEAVTKVAGLPIIRLTLEMGQKISSEWLVALGCSLRGIGTAMHDEEINLSGAEAIDMFHNEQLASFLRLWRVLVPCVLALIIIVAIAADSFLGGTRTQIQSQTVSLNGMQSAAASMLEASSTAFNNEVALVTTAEESINKNYKVIAEISQVADANGVAVNHISFQAPSTPILFSGSAPSVDKIIALKTALSADEHFSKIDLPPSNIQQAGGVYTFQMTLQLAAGF